MAGFGIGRLAGFQIEWREVVGIEVGTVLGIDLVGREMEIGLGIDSVEVGAGIGYVGVGCAVLGIVWLAGNFVGFGIVGENQKIVDFVGIGKKETGFEQGKHFENHCTQIVHFVGEKLVVVAEIVDFGQEQMSVDFD